MAPPCCSVFRPFYNVKWLPEDLQQADGMYDAKSQWWTFIELERYLALNYEKFAPKVKMAFQSMENGYLEEAALLEKHYDGDIQKLKDFSMKAAKESCEAARAFIKEIKSTIKTKDIDRMLLSYFVQTSQGCGMPYEKEIIR